MISLMLFYRSYITYSLVDYSLASPVSEYALLMAVRISSVDWLSLVEPKLQSMSITIFYSWIPSEPALMLKSYLISFVMFLSVSMTIFCLCLSGSCVRTYFFSLRIIILSFSRKNSSFAFWQPLYSGARVHGFMVGSQYL